MAGRAAAGPRVPDRVLGEYVERTARIPEQGDVAQAAAQVLRMRVLSFGVKTEEEIKSALAVMARERPDALLVLADRLLLHHRTLIMDFATRHRLPGVHAYLELVEAGD